MSVELVYLLRILLSVIDWIILIYHQQKDGVVESLWLEIINNENRYIVGGVYRHPGYNIKTFCTNLENSVEHE